MKIEKLFKYLVISLLLVLPLAKGLASVFMVMLFLLSLIKASQVSFYKLWQQGKLVLIPTVVFFIYLAGMAVSSDINNSFSFLLKQTNYILLPFSFFVFREEINKDFSKYIRFFIFGNLISAGAIILFFILPPFYTLQITEAIPLLKDYDPSIIRNLFGHYSPFVDRLQCAYLLGISINCLFYLWFKNGVKRIDFLILLLLLSALLILGARGAQLAFLGTLSIWGGYSIYQKFYYRIANKIGNIATVFTLAAVLIILIGTLPFVAFHQLPFVKKRYEQMKWELGTFNKGKHKDHSYEHFTTVLRIISWQKNWELIKEQPISGYGTGNYKKEMKRLYDADQLKLPVQAQHQFFFIWINAGLLGLLLFVGSWGYWLRAFFRKKEMALSLFALTFSIFYLFVFQLDAPLNYQVGRMTFIVLMCLISCLKNENLTA